MFNEISDLFTKSDQFFGYSPQLLHGRKKRFQSAIGGLFCYTYLLILLGYAGQMIVLLAQNKTTGLNKDFKFIDANDLMIANSKGVNNNTDFNMAFGFLGT